MNRIEKILNKTNTKTKNKNKQKTNKTIHCVKKNRCTIIVIIMLIFFCWVLFIISLRYSLPSFPQWLSRTLCVWILISSNSSGCCYWFRDIRDSINNSTINSFLLQSFSVSLTDYYYWFYHCISSISNHIIDSHSISITNIFRSVFINNSIKEFLIDVNLASIVDLIWFEQCILSMLLSQILALLPTQIWNHGFY